MPWFEVYSDPTQAARQNKFFSRKGQGFKQQDLPQYLRKVHVSHLEVMVEEFGSMIFPYLIFIRNRVHIRTL